MKTNIWEEPLPEWEHRFNTLLNNKEYKFKLFDVNNPDTRTPIKGKDQLFQYFLYKIIPEKDYVEEGLYTDETYEFYFPKKSFWYALMRRLSSQRDIKEKLMHSIHEAVDVKIMFSRTRVKMEISSIEII